MIDRFLAEHADEMLWCRATLVPQPPDARPQPPDARIDLGIDVPLPGVPARGPEVRLVAFSGHRHYAQGKVAPFEGSLRGWSARLDREHSAKGTWIMASPSGDSDLRLDSTLSVAPTDNPNTATLKIEWKRLRQGSGVAAKESHSARTLQTIRLQPTALESAAPMHVVIPWQWYGGDWFSEGAWKHAAEVDPKVLSCWQSALDHREDLTLHAMVSPMPLAKRAARASDVSWAPRTSELLTGLATDAMERYVVHCSREFAESQERTLREDLDSSLARWQAFQQEQDRVLEGLQQRIASWRRELDPAEYAQSYRSAQAGPNQASPAQNESVPAWPTRSEASTSRR
jgi:hypothetical protein